MKIGEALSNRKDLLNKANEMVQRATSCAVVDKENPSDEDPMAYMKQASDLYKAHKDLSDRINEANITHGIMHMTSERDAYRNIAAQYRNLAQSGRVSINRYSRDETVYVANFDVKEAQRLADEYAAAARRLDVKIQETDWTIDIA